MQWHEKLINCSEQLGISWRWLEDGRLWTSVDVTERGFVRDALALFRQIDGELLNDSTWSGEDGTPGKSESASNGAPADRLELQRGCKGAGHTPNHGAQVEA